MTVTSTKNEWQRIFPFLLKYSFINFINLFERVIEYAKDREEEHRGKEIFLLWFTPQVVGAGSAEARTQKLHLSLLMAGTQGHGPSSMPSLAS